MNSEAIGEIEAISDSAQHRIVEKQHSWQGLTFRLDGLGALYGLLISEDNALVLGAGLSLLWFGRLV